MRVVSCYCTLRNTLTEKKQLIVVLEPMCEKDTEEEEEKEEEEEEEEEDEEEGITSCMN